MDLKELDVKMWTEFNSLSIGSIGDLLCTC
jgi:hypothetical protein